MTEAGSSAGVDVEVASAEHAPAEAMVRPGGAGPDEISSGVRSRMAAVRSTAAPLPLGLKYRERVEVFVLGPTQAQELDSCPHTVAPARHGIAKLASKVHGQDDVPPDGLVQSRIPEFESCTG